MELPLVSIVVPYFAKEDQSTSRLLRETLGSLQRQTYENFEIIVVDDGSEIRETMELSDIGVSVEVIYHDRRKGLAAARNTGVACARGDAIVPLDFGNFLEPEFLTSTVDSLLDGFDVVQTLARPLVESSSREYTAPECNINQINSFDAASVDESSTTCGTILFKKELFPSIGGYSTSVRLSENHDFWLKLLSQGRSVNKIASALVTFRRRDPEIWEWPESAHGGTPPANTESERDSTDAHAPYSSLESDWAALRSDYEQLYREWKNEQGDLSKFQEQFSRLMDLYFPARERKGKGKSWLIRAATILRAASSDGDIAQKSTPDK